jgi:hypothetical protein
MQIEKLTNEEVFLLSKPFWDNLIVASNEESYLQFSKDFSTEMLKSTTCEAIENQWKSEPLLTTLLPNPEFIGFLKNIRGIRVLWKQKLANSVEEQLGHLELIFEDGRIKVDGAQIL